MYKTVVIGGGNGTAKSIVALKNYIDELELSAVVSMSDSGGSTGVLREKFNSLPPGDIMRALLAMSKHDYQLLKDIFYRARFENVGSLSKHNLGNLFLVLAARESKDYVKAIRAFEQAVEAVGKVYPATLEQSDLVVELSDGSKVKGEAEIDRPTYSRDKRITKAWLEPEVSVYEEAAKVIESADVIVIAGGSLYTSLVAALLPKGISEAVKKSQAKIITVVSKAYEAQGETGPTTVSEYLDELHQYLPRTSDYVLFNASELTQEKEKLNRDAGWELYEVDEENLKDYNFIKADLERDSGFAIDPNKLGKELMNIIGE